MVYTNTTNLVWANAERTQITCNVTFETIGTVPFTATAEGDTEYSHDIFNRCVAGDFGPIADYVTPEIVAAKNQPATTGTQTL